MGCGLQGGGGGSMPVLNCDETANEVGIALVFCVCVTVCNTVNIHY